MIIKRVEVNVKLVNFRVQEFRSIWDSNEITVNDAVCFAGKNESGKTSLLVALSRLNPLDPDALDAKFDVVRDYPIQEMVTYKRETTSTEDVSAVRSHSCPIAATFQLDADDVSEIENSFGKCIEVGTNVRVSVSYDNLRSMSYEFKQDVASEFVNSAVEDDENKQKPENIRLLMDEKIAELLPKFLYFDDYYQLTGKEDSAQLMGRQTEKTLKPADYPLVGFLKTAGINLKEIHTPGIEEAFLSASLQDASNKITTSVLTHWSQNKKLRLIISLKDGFIYAKVRDELTQFDHQIDFRSKGFLWFCSFLSWYEGIKDENLILLLDEPGLSLHGRAQTDLISYLHNELIPKHQVLYTTHSPFMIDGSNLSRVRIVENESIEAKEPLPREKDGTKVIQNFHEVKADSLIPLRSALGYDITQSLFIGENTLVVEGPADLHFLQGMSQKLMSQGREGLSDEWVILYAGGAFNIAKYAVLLNQQRGMNVVTLMDHQFSTQANLLKDSKILPEERILTYAMFAKREVETDVEDMFDREFYLSLVNGTFRPQNPISQIGQEDRVLDAIENVWKKFSHYKPASYFAQKYRELKISDDTLTRFEDMFIHLNGLLVIEQA